MENLASLCVGHSPNFLLFIPRGIPNVLAFVWARFLALSLFGAVYLLIISSPSVYSIRYLRFYLRLLSLCIRKTVRPLHLPIGMLKLSYNGIMER